jgi:Fe-S oxidoreductase
MGAAGYALFWGLTAAAAGIFLWRSHQLLRLVLLGRGAPERGRLRRRALNAAAHLLLQVCQFKNLTRRNRASFGHAFMVWGFLLFGLYYTLFIVIGEGFGASEAMEHNRFYGYYSWVIDIAAPFVFVGALWAIVRRYVIRPERLKGEMTIEALFILLTVLIHPVTHIGKVSSQIAAGSPPAGLGIATPLISTAVSNLYTNPAAIEAWNRFWFWSHWGSVLVVLVIIGYTRYLHMIAGVLNDILGRDSSRGMPELMDVANPATLGASRIDQFTCKQLLDSLSCVVCGYCQEACPAAQTDKPLNPKLVMRGIKTNLLQNGPLLAKGRDAPAPLIGGDGQGSVSPDALWACTTCGVCMQVCPMYIEHVAELVEMRRHLVQREAKFPEELLNLFENVEQRSNPWGMTPADRGKWAAEMERPFEAGKTEYLFYVGCFGSFDSRAKQVTVAMARILDAAGVSWGILGRGEMCCGDSLRRLGNEYVYERLARQNIELFKKNGVRKVVATCPHCFSTLKNDYRQLGAEYEVVSHVELIHRLLKEGRLELSGKPGLGSVVFHDSCYLGRYNDIYAEPREVIASVTGQAPGEMERHHKRSFCCGGGGGRMWMEERVGKRINIERVREALKSSPQAICVACPYCITMFEDGLRDQQPDSAVRVLDVAEVVSAALVMEPSGASPLEASLSRG